MADLQGKTVCGYTIKSRLGIGGMAEVWYAENKIGKKAAVKLLLPKFCDDEAVVSRFLTEAKVMVELDHPNIRQVYDYDNLDGRPTIIMEYLEGDDLKARMKAGQRFTDDEFVKWWNQLVDALKYTHEKGIVHRDIKPGNIFVDNKGNIKLLDFGIAKVRESISSTQTGQKIGTLMYMSPEQVKDSKHIDYHTDIYSLAVTFVHLLTGKKPYDSDTSSDFDIQLNIVSKPLDLSDVPDKWQAFLEPYLDKEASKRPELRYFEVVMPEHKPEPKPEPKKPEEKPVEQSDSDDEGTIVDGAEEPEPAMKAEPEKSDGSDSSDNPKNKSKLGLWIGLALAAVVGVIVALNRPDKDAEWYNKCHSVADYRGYVSYYGKNAKHYYEAKYFIDRYVADSTSKAQKAQAEAEAKAKAKAEYEAQEKATAQAKAKKEAEAKKKAEEETKKKLENTLFSVSPTKKVQFSKGNLQYQASTKTWRFAEHQWDIIGSANEKISSDYDGWIDLFGWGTGDNPTNISTDNNDYGSFREWGNNKISNGAGKKWYTLTNDEWLYLLNDRSTSSGLRHVPACINDIIGHILLPDNWNIDNYPLENTSHSFDNKISLSDWTSKLEPNGAIFLPRAGCRTGIDYSLSGHYWSATYRDNESAYQLWSAGSIFGAGVPFYRWNGASVRLVTDVE